jgi:pimeloyl-ACP methyl ester carboxylesterase
VANVLPNDLEAETYFDMDRSAWQRLRQDALSLPWQMVSAAGVEQAAACIGAGAPTVVYVDGFASAAAPHWSQAAIGQSEANRVCLFDRPGMGLSPDRAGAAPHSTPEQHAQEMLDMLAVLGEPGPYLLAGWSYGGLVARTAAAQHPEQVAGLVLVDATSPLQPGLDEPLQGENGIVDADTIAATVGEGPDMDHLPVIVLQRGQPEKGAPADWEETWNDLQAQAATISENSLHGVVDESDHAIPIRNPGAVVAATTAVAESIRAGNADLPACPDDLAAAGVTCTGP